MKVTKRFFTEETPFEIKLYETMGIARLSI